MDRRAPLQEFLTMETFWIKYYTAPQLRSQLDGSGLFLVLIGIANIGIGVWIVEDSTQYASQLSLMVSAALSILIGAFIILVISVSYARPTTRGRSKDQSPIDTESRLFKDICGLIARMNYSSPLALVYESRTRSWIPSVFKLNSKMYALVVPAGLMLLKRGERLALLAHEIAHIEQDDVGLWLASDRLAAGLRVVALLLLSVCYCLSWRSPWRPHLPWDARSLHMLSDIPSSCFKSSGYGSE